MQAYNLMPAFFDLYLENSFPTYMRRRLIVFRVVQKIQI